MAIIWYTFMSQETPKTHKIHQRKFHFKPILANQQRMSDYTFNKIMTRADVHRYTISCTSKLFKNIVIDV
jgi:hypothetical protein